MERKDSEKRIKLIAIVGIELESNLLDRENDNPYKVGPQCNNKEEKGKIIVYANAFIYPVTMVVVSVYTSFTDVTMSTSGSYQDFTFWTYELKVYLFHYQLNLLRNRNTSKSTELGIVFLIKPGDLREIWKIKTSKKKLKEIVMISKAKDSLLVY